MSYSVHISELRAEAGDAHSRGRAATSRTDEEKPLERNLSLILERKQRDTLTLLHFYTHELKTP